MSVREYASRISAAYKAGYDCGARGANTENCHFRHFMHPELTSAWERGKKQADEELRREAR